MPEGFSITTRWASSKAIRNPAGVLTGLGAVSRSSRCCPACTRAAGSRIRSPSRRTLPVAHSRLTSFQLLPARRRRRAAATVPPTSSEPTTIVSAPPNPANPMVPGSATNHVEHALERAVELLGPRSAPLRHVGAPAALAADRLGDLAHDLAGVEPAGEVGRHHRDERDLVPLDAGENDHPRAQLVAQLIGDLAQGLRIGDVGAGGQHPHPTDVARLREEIAPAARGELSAELLDLLLLLAQI